MSVIVLAYFGEKWDAPRLDPTEGVQIMQVPTPLGKPCLWCQQPIELGDRGLMQPTVRQAGSTLEPAHMECDMLPVVGHQMGVCTCTGFTGDHRAAALELLKRINDQRALAGWGPM